VLIENLVGGCNDRSELMGLARRATFAKAAKLGRESASGDRGNEAGIDDTLRVNGTGHTQHRTAKAASGGSAMALPRSRVNARGSMKSRRGHE
jgi:hypothetical protein